MRMRIGRNQQCPCGSGKKYKKCCLLRSSTDTPSFEEISQIRDELYQKSQARKFTLESHGIYIDFPNPVIHKGQSIWALGSRLYHVPIAGITFHECCLEALKMESDQNWVKEQEQLPLEDRHFILKSFYHFKEWRQRNKSERTAVGINTWSCVPDGWSKSLISLAFDIACIIHVNGHVPKKIFERLMKSDNNYQGARYEVAVAAILARIGCKLRFLDEELDHRGDTPLHCEFIAYHPETNETFAVEAKSKVRKGVLHCPGISDAAKLWSNVTSPYLDALHQNPETIPFMVFVDANCPPTPGVSLQDKPWLKDILASRKATPFNTPDNPDPCTVITYTNYSYHYQTNQEAASNEALMIAPNYPKYKVSDLLLNRLGEAIKNYNYIPDITYDGNVRA